MSGRCGLSRPYLAIPVDHQLVVLRTPRTIPMLMAWNQWEMNSGTWPAALASKTNWAVVWR